MDDVPTASQTVGPFFSIGMTQLCRAEMVTDSERAQRISVRGRLSDGDGQGVPDAVLEIWSPTAAGKASSLGSEKYPNGFARVATDDRGEFAFTGPKPEATKAEAKSDHAPHFVVLVLMRGLLRHLVTRIYFPDEPGNVDDRVLKVVPENRRHTIVARPSPGEVATFIWDIHLQGQNETVFFDA